MDHGVGLTTFDPATKIFHWPLPHREHRAGVIECSNKLEKLINQSDPFKNPQQTTGVPIDKQGVVFDSQGLAAPASQREPMHDTKNNALPLELPTS